MRINTYTDYSLRVLIHAAAKYPVLATVQEVADAFAISRNHLMKVISELARAGYLKTQRGRTGGFTLARPANRLKIGEIVRFCERDSVLVECFDPVSNRCAITPACRLKFHLHEALEAFYAVLDRYTVADLYDRPEAVLRHLGLLAAK
jgi:Rrf2 family transcriptional regulator, nitric oxide-sensitive transcriptional repressor